jgi:hypothetical protein
MAAVPRDATASANDLNSLMRSFGTTLAESAGGDHRRWHHFNR